MSKYQKRCLDLSNDERNEIIEYIKKYLSDQFFDQKKNIFESSLGLMPYILVCNYIKFIYDIFY